MNVATAARLTRERIGRATSERSINGNTVEHAAWMLDGIVQGYIQHDKAHRWLGYAQALIVALTDIRLEDMKEVNKEA